MVAAPKKTKRLKSTGGYTKATNLSSSQAPAVGSAVPEEETTPICHDKVQSALNYVQNLVGFVPVYGDAIAAVAGFGSQVLSDACPKGGLDERITKKFAEIDERLNKIDIELNGLNYTVANLQKKIATNETNNVLSDMYVAESNLRSLYLEKYTKLIETSNLNTYVQQNGKLKKVFPNSENVRTLLNNIPNQITLFNNLISNQKLTNLKSALDSICIGTNVSGDIISTRVSCDMAISRITYTYGFNAVKMKLMIDDEIATINNAIKSGNVDTAWLKANIGGLQLNGNQTISWDKAEDAVNKVIDDKINFINETLIGVDGSKLYKPLDGLPETLQQNIIAANCSYRTNEKSPILPAIKEWHTINENDASNKTPYIVTECDDGTGNKITSKYYYNKHNTTELDDKVMNAMGVLVPDRYFHGGAQNNFSYAPVFPWTNSSIVVADSTPNSYNSFTSPYYLKGYFNIPSGNAKSYAIGYDPASYKQTTIVPGTDKNDDDIIGFKEESAGVFVTSYKAVSLRRPFFTILRYTKDDYTYVWAMSTEGYYEQGGAISDYKYSFGAMQQCITNDCNVNNTGTTLGQINFLDKTTIDWVTNRSNIKYDPKVPLATYSEYTIKVK